MNRDDEISEIVIARVAEKAGTDEEVLPPLYESIEADALDELFLHATEKSGTGLLVQFPYAGYTVTIEEPGDVTIE